jgi:hypothetical protein
MSRHDAVGGGTVMLAFIAGSLAGAAVALLFAPAAGDETRQFLNEKAREGRGRRVPPAAAGRRAERRRPRAAGVRGGAGTAGDRGAHVTDWSPVFLGVIAGAVLVMALIQVGAVIAAARLATHVNRLAQQVERDMAPLVANLQTIGAEAARASALATAQVERADRLFADVSAKVEETTSVVQQAIMAPAREGLAIMAGLRAALTSLRYARQHAAVRRSARTDEDDPLFIG